MKTRTMTNKNKDSFRVDVIDQGELSSHYFKTEKEANTFIKFKKLEHKYKDFI